MVQRYETLSRRTIRLSPDTYEDSFLVTGNLKHFPKEPQVITAAEMMKILDNEL